MDKLRLKNYCFTCLLVIFFGLFTFSGYSTTYYVSSSGNDSNSGLTTALPWKTLTKINGFTFKPGDQILFQRGSTFYGTLTVKNSGTTGSPIVYGAYGSGVNPVITGFTQVTSWTSKGGNIWESTSTVSSLTTCNMVVNNGVNTPMGRFPKTGYYFYQSHSDNYHITSNNLTGTPNWTGAELAFNNNRFEVKRCPVINQSGSTLTFTQPEPFAISRNGLKFIIQNDLRCLTQQNDWYYNPKTKKLSIYSTSQPINVKIATMEVLVTNTAQDYITLDGIDFIGSNSKTILLGSGNYSVIKNCNFNYAGLNAIFGGYNGKNTGLVIQGCTFNNSNNGAIGVTYFFANASILSNTITNTGMIYGATSTIVSKANDAGVGKALSAKGSGTLIEGNIVKNTASTGIQYQGDNVTVRKNYVYKFCQNLHDGGGIYTWNGSNTSHSGTKISQNTVINVLVTSDAQDESSGLYDACIYLDDSSNGIEISDNNVSGSGIGIFLINSHDVSVLRNIAFNNEIGIRYYTLLGIKMSNITIANNQFIAKAANQLCLKGSEIENILSGISTANNYYARPIDDNIVFQLHRILPIPAYLNYNLTQWKTYSAQDAQSLKSPQAITNLNDIKFEFNETSNSKTVALNSPMIDIKGTKYATSISLPPYSSVVLMKDNNPAPTDITVPIVTDFSVPSSYNSLSVPVINYKATDNIAVTGFKITESSAVPKASDTGWSTNAATSFTFASEGTKTLYAWAKDAAGNISKSMSASVVVTLNSSTNIMGNTEVYSSIAKLPYLRAMPVTFSENATITNISIYHDGGNGNLLLGVYSDQSNTPSSLLGATTSTTVNLSAGWQNVTLTSPITVTVGQTVWLSWQFQNPISTRYSVGTPGRAQSTKTWTGEMPVSFGPSINADYRYSIYCTYVLANQPTGTLGETEVYNSIAKLPYLRAMPVTFSENATITNISIYHDGGNGNLLLGVYSDQSNTPSSLLGATTSTTVNLSAGWQNVKLTSPITVTAGQTVWLSWQFQNPISTRYSVGTPGRAQSTKTWTGGMPLSFGSSTNADYRYSIYCTYSVTTTTLKNATIPEVIVLESVSSTNAGYVNEEVNDNLSIESSINLIDENDFKLYPNPAKSFVNVDYTFMPERGTTIEIIDGDGKKIYEKLQVTSSNRIDIDQLNSGIYFIRSINNQKYNVKKLIIQ